MGIFLLALLTHLALAATQTTFYQGQTPENDTIQPMDFIYINVSVSDPEGNYTYGFTDLYKSEGFIPYTGYEELIRWYRFENDSSVGENNTLIYDWSTYEKNATSYGADPSLQGKFGSSFYFSDVASPRDHVLIDTGPVASLSSSFTISLWFKLGSLLGTTPSLYGEGQDPDGSPTYDALHYYYDSSGDEIGAYVYGLGDNPYPWVHGGVVNETTKWYHTAFVKINSTEYRLYLNGVEVDSYSGVAHSQMQIDYVTIGNAYIFNSEYPFTGYVDEFLIFRRALDSNEIEDLYNFTRPEFSFNYTGLDEGNHDFQSFTIDAEGNKNQTDKRRIEIDYDACSINCSTNPSPDRKINCGGSDLYFYGHGTATLMYDIVNHNRKTVVNAQSSADRCQVNGFNYCFGL